jgi:hypothetical protein
LKGAVDEIGELSDLIPQADITIVNFYTEAIVPSFWNTEMSLKRAAS